MKKYIELLKKSFQEWSEDKAPRLAAALSYYMIFSLPPLLMIVVGIAGMVYSEGTARQELITQIESLIGAQGGQAVGIILENVSQPGAGLITTIIGVALAIFGATGVFAQLQDALNTIWEVKRKPGGGVMGFVRTRLLSFAMVLAIAFLLLVSLVISAGLSILADYLEGVVPLPPIALQVINFVISFGVVTLLFALMFKYVPDAEVAWKDVWLGAAITSFLFTIGRELLSIYLGNAGVASSFGAAGSLIILLLWIYYTAQILFFGAEFTQVYANHYGDKVRPAEHAEWLTDEERATQGMIRKTPASAPTLTPVPVTAVSEIHDRLQTPALPAPRSPRVSPIRLLQMAGPALLAFGLTIAGSLAIVREQKKMETEPNEKVRKQKKKIFESFKWQK